MAFLSGHNPLAQNLLDDAEINKLIQSIGQPQAELNSATLKAHQHGEFGSAETGSGSDFAEVRAYYHGDDPRMIDWRATARASIPLVRTFHSELSRPLCILIDRTDSMRYATRVRLKAAQALRLALCIGAQELRKQRSLSFIILDHKSHWLPEQQGLNSLKNMLRQANRPCPPVHSPPVNWALIIAGITQHIAEGTELILLSDFNALQPEHYKSLKKLGQYCQCTAVHIVDPSELNPAFPADTELTWKNQSLSLASSEHQSPALQAMLDNRLAQLDQLFYKSGIHYSRLSVARNNLSSAQHWGC